MVNLLLNARDAGPDGGRIDVSARRRGRRVLVRVEDRGPGVSPADRRRIFEPFFTTKSAGSGLGLGVVRSMLDTYGGKIRVRARRGGGAVFELDLAAAPGAPRASAVPGPGRRVLAVDDDPAVRQSLRLALARHRLTLCEDGRGAIAALRDGGRFDVVLTDLSLPGASGWDVARAARAHAPGARVYLLTGWAAAIRTDDVRRGLVDAVLPRTTLPAELDRIVAGPAADRSPRRRVRRRPVTAQ
jgi:CheY-like chemotaxis protein